MPEPGESIAVATLPNLRDLGGWVGADGRSVRRGLVYRSTDLSRLDQTGCRQIAELGVRTVYDLRSAAERSTEPDVRLDGVAEVVLDVLADAPHAVPGNLTALLSDPTRLSAAQEVLGGKSLNELMTDSYAQLITLPSARESYRRFYRGLLGEDDTPALFHCTTGKDRTGWAAASLLSVLGVSREDVFTEYLLTNDQLVPALEPVLTAFEHAGGDRTVLLAVIGVDRSYLERAFAEVDQAYGGIEGYLADGLGIPVEEQEALRERFLDEG